MTEAERKAAEIRSIMRMAGVEEPKEAPKKPAKKQTKKKEAK